MAPTITSSAEYPKEHLNLTHKIRKPIVEKMRRDRINNSIEELKALLSPRLLNQQSDSKLEKANILEITVGLLRQQLQHKTLQPSNAIDQGLSRCTQEVVSFLSEDEVLTQSHGTLLNNVQILKPSYDEDKQLLLCTLDQQTLCKQKSSIKCALWRPW